jgi:hypothetical protein
MVLIRKVEMSKTMLMEIMERVKDAEVTEQQGTGGEE